jgi:hypothetical protein
VTGPSSAAATSAAAIGSSDVATMGPSNDATAAATTGLSDAATTSPSYATATGSSDAAASSAAASGPDRPALRSCDRPRDRCPTGTFIAHTWPLFPLIVMVYLCPLFTMVGSIIVTTVCPLVRVSTYCCNLIVLLCISFFTLVYLEHIFLTLFLELRCWLIKGL